MKVSIDKINLATQILSAIFYALFLAGFKQIDPNQDASEIISAFKAQSLPLILGALINFGTMVYLWIRTWKTDKPNFWAFLTSRSWIISLGNIVIPLLTTAGFYLSDADYTKLVDLALSKDWKGLISMLVITIIGFIGTKFKPSLRVTTNNLEAKQAKTSGAKAA